MRRSVLFVSAVLLFWIGFSGIFSLSFSQDWIRDDLHKAEEGFKSGDFPEAISRYEGIIQKGWTNGEIYYNLGNCYYKLGEYGKAILNYERAKLYLGNDADLETNLTLANLRIYDRITPLPRIFIIRVIEFIGGLLPVRRWALLFLVSEWLLLLCLILLNTVHRPQWRRLFIISFVVLVGAFVLSGGFFLQQKVQKENSAHAIVLQEKVTAKSAPESGSTELFTLHEGVKIRLLRTVVGWSEIRLADGKRGWLPGSAFEII